MRGITWYSLVRANYKIDYEIATLNNHNLLLFIIAKLFIMASILQEEYIKECGKIEVPPMITNLIPQGVTIFYGASGVGKTASIINHLNNHNIEPLLIDFDDNSHVYETTKCELIDGEWFLKKTRARAAKLFDDQRRAKVVIDDLVLECFKDNPYDAEAIAQSYRADNYKRFIKEKLGTLDEFDKSLFDKCFKDMQKGVKLEDVYRLEAEVLIIDTYAYCIPFFDDNLHFEKFVRNLCKQVKSVIVVSHEIGERGGDTEVDAIFANHAQAKLRLKRDITKTKGEEINLFVEKLRGYKGKPIIKDWER